jgi:dihydroxy-acid dehydratase
VALGGSTNAVLHLLAMAKAADVPLTIDDFQAVSNRTPLLADMKPSGPWVMEDLWEVGGVPGGDEAAAENGLLHGDCLTVTGKTVAENLAELPGLNEGQRIVSPLSKPIKADRPLADSLRQPGDRRRRRQDHRQGRHQFTGPAKVFDSEELTLEALQQGRITHGDVVVIRYEGPKGGPGCARCSRSPR